jgi:chromosome segregation ATPase
MKHITDISALISDRQRKLDTDFEAHQQKQAALTAQAALEAAALQPAADAVANLRTQLNGLTSRRDALLEEIAIGSRQIDQQKQIVAQLDRTVAAIFGKQSNNVNDFKNQVAVNPTLPFAEMLVEKFSAMLAQKQDELAEVEAEIVELARTK